MNAPEAYIRFTPGLIAADGTVTDDSTAGFLRGFMQELHTFIVRVYTVLPRNTAMRDAAAAAK
jgi:chromate reductase